MRLRPVLKHVVPEPVRRLGWRNYYRVRDNWREGTFDPRQAWLKTIVGCQTTRKVVALTFDDGPNPGDTPRILDILSHYQVKATFFLLGRNVAAYPDLTREVVHAGHAVGNHTFTHPYLPDCKMIRISRELRQCQQTIRQVTGVATRLMRPPYGAQSPKNVLIARLMGYSIVTWSVSGEDWDGSPASMITQRVLTKIRPGDIILLHDSWEEPPSSASFLSNRVLLQDRSPTIEALPRIIEPLRNRGYELVTLPELFQIGKPILRPWFRQ